MEEAQLFSIVPEMLSGPEATLAHLDDRTLKTSAGEQLRSIRRTPSGGEASEGAIDFCP